MKKIILSATLLLSILTVSVAQTPKELQRIKADINKMSEVLTLTQQQQDSILVFKIDYSKTKQSAILFRDTDLEKYKATMKAANRKYGDSLDRIFTPEQGGMWKKYLEDQKNSKKKK